jgi:hypothetical protein
LARAIAASGDYDQDSVRRMLQQVEEQFHDAFPESVENLRQTNLGQTNSAARVAAITGQVPSKDSERRARHGKP